MKKEKKIIEISKKNLKDFGREYFPDTIKIRLPKELKEWYGANYPFDFDVSRILIGVPDEQFGSTGVFSIYFKDENLEPFMFHDGGAEGRTPNLKIIKKNGKYTIGDEWKG
ncbi:hypothetical protein [Empedobacter brevis]|uniref:hypothetical protein n=1 Tax=Empedobacter brevis TaxID=247 RepID=UPI0028ACBEA4|nr:hypothetical protein [Empedobacter brevis]